MNNITKIYKFYDTDNTGTEEYEISGKEYKKLIEICCKYCTVLSLVVTNPNSNILKKLRKYEIKKSDNISFNYEHYSNLPVIVNYYTICSELREIILADTNNIFCWINGWGFTNPEDPTFYRNDGSVFFTSTIHEGECTLMIKDENVSEIISNPHWKMKSSDTMTEQK